MNLDQITWTKSSYSTGSGNCVEIADVGCDRAVRDSKHPERGHLSFTSCEWSAFVAAVKRDQFGV